MANLRNDIEVLRSAVQNDPIKLQALQHLVEATARTTMGLGDLNETLKAEVKVRQSQIVLERIRSNNHSDNC